MSLSISIITVASNEDKTITDCIESVLRQTKKAEHYIVDAGSTDGTIPILDKYKNQNAITYSSEPDKGIYDAMNKGIEKTSGDIVGILNADDFYVDNHVLERIAKVFNDKNIDACYSDLVYIDNRDPNRIVRNWIAGHYDRKSFHSGWMPPHPTFFVRRSLYEKYGRYNISLGTAADYELMLRFLYKNKIRTQYIPEVLIKMRTGGVSNASISNRLRANKMDKLAWKVNELKPYPWTFILKPMRKINQFSFI